MASVKHISEDDFLNDGRVKINEFAIDPANRAEVNSKQAITDANKLGNEAKKTAKELGDESIKIARDLGDKSIDIANKSDEQSLEAIEIAKNTNENMNNIISGETDSSEIIAARKPIDDKPFLTVGERLDTQLGKLSVFRPEDKSVIDKIKNEFKEKEINVKWFGAKGDGVVYDSEPIQKALDFGGNILIPAGEYIIEKQLILSDNTNLVIDDNAVLYNHIHQTQPKGLKGISILANYDVDTPVDGYNLPGNITITGGTLCGVRSIEDKNILEPLGDVGQDGISISHAENIKIENVTVKNTFRGHGIEITGCNKVDVINCTLDGCILTSVDIAAAREAIQLEHSGTNTSPSLQDKTLTKNIRVIGCEITKTTEWANHWASGIGSHNNNNEEQMENIIIEKNRITNCTFGGILVINYKNAEINNNVILNCERGIHYYSSRSWDNVRVIGNRIENINKSGIAIYEGSVNVKVLNNTFVNIQDAALIGQDVSGVKVSGNEFIDCALNETANASVIFYGISHSNINDNSFKLTVNKSVQRGLFISETASLKNKNVYQSNNAFLSEFKISDLYLSDTAIWDNLILDKPFDVYKDSQITLKESILKYKMLTLDVFIGADASVTVPVSRSMKVVITNVSKGANSVNFTEFTILVNTVGDKLTISQDRISTITDGGQATQNIPQSLKISIKQIKGNY